VSIYSFCHHYPTDGALRLLISAREFFCHMSGVLGLVHVMLVCYCFGWRDIVATDTAASKTSITRDHPYAVPWLAILTKAPFWLVGYSCCIRFSGVVAGGWGPL